SDSTSAAHIGVIYPLSTNGKSAGSISNHFSLHLLSGYSKSETGLALSGLANIIRENTTGAAIAGLVNQVGENAHGVQIAGIGNYVKDTASGVMIGGIYNVAANSRIQLGGIANFVKN